MAKGSTTFAVVFVMFGATAVGMFSANDDKPIITENPGWGTVSYDVPTDGSAPTAHSPLENIGYMSRKLKEQESWYSEMHGSVNTIIKQEVTTYKQFSEGVLISADISTSSMVNTAKQFCFVGDSVLWREAAVGASQYNGINTEWKTGDPVKISVDQFRTEYGLPATEFSVYVINEDTLLSATDVVDNGDGTFSQTYELNPQTDKAPFYYRQQMLKTGGLSKWPEFSSISVTYTFDSEWQVLKSEISESYSVTMGPVSTSCTATYVTVYEYGTEKTQSTAYSDYFSKFADKPNTDIPAVSDPTAAGCLASAFGSVLTGPATFELSLDLNGTALHGFVYVDVAQMDIRAKIGNIGVWYSDDTVYLSYGGLKLRMSVEELLGLVGTYLPYDSEGAGFDTDALLQQLGGGEFAVSDGKATLNAELSLMGLNLPVDFSFLLDEKNNATLEYVRADIALGEFSIGAELGFGEAELPALTDEERAGYIDIMPYAETLAELFTSDVLGAEIAYEGNGVSLAGGVSLSVADKAAQGTLAVGYSDDKISVNKTVAFAYKDGNAYLNLDGIKIKANAEEAIALIGNYVDLPEMKGFDLNALLAQVFTEQFADIFSAGESDDVLTVTLKGTELLKALGIEFELGEVRLEAENGKLTASAYGANVAVTQGEAFTADTDGYTEIVKYAGYLAELFTTENLKAEVAYEGYGVKVSGQVQLNIKSLKAQAELTVTYGAVTKQIGVIYGDGEVYLEIDGLKVKANVQEAVELVGRFAELPESNLEATEIIEKVLSLNFGEVVSLGESDNVLTVTLKGTELLKALGIEFELGEVKLEAENGKLTASAYGANVTVTQGEAFTADTDGYTEIVKYAGYLAELFTTENLKAEIAYEGYGVKVSGQVQLNIKSVKAQAELTVAYGAVTKQIGVIYGDGEVYLEIDGLKVKANVQEAVALVGRFAELPESNLEATEIIEKVLSLNFGEVVSLGERDDVLTVTLKGTELLKALGIEFELGEVKLEAGNGKLTASAYGANVAVTPGEAFTADTDGYTEIVKYAGYLAELFTTENLKAEIAYEGYGVKVSGQVQLNIKSVKAQAELTVTYGAVTKQIGVIYGDGEVYLEVDGLKVKANVQEAVELVGRFAELPESDIDATAIIEKVLSLNFGEVISLGESDDILTVTLKGTELLKALGIEFELGEVKLEAENGKLTASAYGANVAVTQGEAFTADTDGYIDVMPLLMKLPDIINRKAVSFRAAIDIQLDNKSIVTLDVKNGAVSWENGITVYLDATLIAVNTRHDITVFYDGNRVQVAYGAVGAELLTGEIPQLEEALNVLYGRIKTVVDEISGTKDSVMPESLNDLMNMAGAGADLSGAVENFDFADLLGKLEFCAPNGANGVLGLKLGALTAELTDEADGTIGLVLRADREKVTVWAEAYATALEGQFPAMPELDYLGIDDFADMLDYAGATAELLTKDSYHLEVEGATLSDDIATYPEGQRYGIVASFDYVSGGSFPVHVDLDNNNFWLDPKMYLHAKVMLTAYGAGENNLFVDLYLLDCDPTTKKPNGVLDVYLTVSQIGADSEKPLKFYIPADELMSLLASAVPMFGVENDTLNEMLVNRYLTPEMIGQLRVLGESLMKSLGFDNIFGGISLPIIPNIGAKTAADGERSGLFKSVVFSDTDEGERALTVTLDSDMMYGAEMPKDLSFTVKKAGGLGKSQLTGIELENIYSDDTAVERTGVKATFSDVAPDVVQENPDLGNGYNMCGVSSLLKTIVNSATHETAEPDENGNRYALNDEFYIDGKVSVGVGKYNAFSVDVRGLSVGVDEKGNIEVNLSLHYEEFSVLFMPIVKETSDFYMTVQDNMVYMKRTDNPGEKESVLYRVMPLDNFLGDILNQLIFIFNFGDVIADQIRSSDTSTSSDTVVDWGSYLTSYSYEDAGKWNFTINGNILTNGVLGDIAVGLEADSENVLHKLNVSSSIYKAISLTGELYYRNPCNVWEEGSSDVTNDVSKVLAADMGKAIRETDWTQVTYVDGLPSEVTFIVDGEEVGKQPVAYDSSAKKLYTDILYPAPEKRGHTLVWDKLDEDAPFTGSTTVNGHFNPNLYGVTLTSRMPIEGFDYENGRYVLHTEMEYGAKIEFEAFREVFEIYTVSDGDNVFELPDIPERSGKQGKWSKASISAQEATISAEYNFDTVVYASEIEYTYNGVLYNTDSPYSLQFDVDSDRTLITPQADGYTFLGWFIHTENGWEKVKTFPSSDGNDAVKMTVEALWISDLNVSVTGSRKSVSVGKYDHQVGAEITGGKLIGAFAEEATCETTYGYCINSKSAKPENLTNHVYEKEYRASDSFVARDIYRLYGHAVVTVRWSYSDFTFETSTHGYVKL